MLRKILFIATLLFAFVGCKSETMKDAKVPEPGEAQTKAPADPGAAQPQAPAQRPPQRPPAQPQAPAGPIAAPDFSIPDMDGGKCSLSAHKGKPVLLEFWSMGCGFCRKMIPELAKIADEMKEITIISVHLPRGQDAERIKAEFPEKKFPVCLDDGSAANAYRELPPAYRVGGIPHFLLIDKDGVIRTATKGYKPAATLMAEIRASGILN